VQSKTKIILGLMVAAVSVAELPAARAAIGASEASFSGILGAAEPKSEVSIGFSTEDYFSPASSLRQSIYPSVDVGLKGFTSGSLLEAAGSFQGRLFLSQQTPLLFEAPEAYIGTSARLSEAIQLRLGRQLHSWNQLDDLWKLGIWQPRFRYDPLNPVSVGLLGAHVDVKLPAFRMTVFASPFFVPDRGVPMDISGGAITSPLPFFVPPARTIPIEGVSTPLHYTLNMPPIEQILLNPSFSSQVRIGEQQGVWGAAAYAYKPMNQILMAYNYALNVATNPNIAEATLFPRLMYHHVVSVEGGYESSAFGFRFSALGEAPLRDETPTQWVTQEVAPSLALSPSVYYRFGANPQPTSPTLMLSYLRQWGGNLPDRNAPAGTGLSNFENRYLFQNAVLGNLRMPLPLGLGVSTQLLYDIGHDGMISMNELSFRPITKWLPRGGLQMTVGADFLVTGVLSTTLPGASDLISMYAENSRIRAGVSYVF
jgi:hypothetical protein